MKYLKQFEKIKDKNISIGRIYRSGPWHVDSKVTIPLIKIIEINNVTHTMVGKTYFKGSEEERIHYHLRKEDLKNIASPEEIEFFNSIENIKKYNL